MTSRLICVIDDDCEVRGSLDSLFRSAGHEVRTFEHPSEYLACDPTDEASCLVLDVRLQGMDGLDFQQALSDRKARVPVILISGHGDIPMTVRAMRAGAVTFLPKPFEEEDMLLAVEEALERDHETRSAHSEACDIRARFETLSPREREVMALVTAGLMNKQVAGRLQLSEITVKIHRGNVTRKMHAQSLADLVRMAESLGVRDACASRFNQSRLRA